MRPHCIPPERSIWASCPVCRPPRRRSPRSSSRRPAATSSTSRLRSTRGPSCWSARGPRYARSACRSRSTPSCTCWPWTPRRGGPTVTRLLDELEALDMRRRALTGQLDQLKAERNEAVKADARLMKEKGALPPDVRESRRALGERIDRLEAELKGIEEALDEKLLYVPNPPPPDVRDADRPTHQTVRRVDVRPGRQRQVRDVAQLLVERLLD